MSKTVTKEQAHALIAFMESFDLLTTGVWLSIESEMRANWGVEDPETILESAREALQ